MKKTFILLAILGFSLAFGAGEFDKVDGVVTSFDNQVSSTAGVGLRTFMGWLPVILFGVGTGMGLKHSKQQADQDRDNNKVLITVAVASIGGAIVGVLIDAAIGAALLQDSMQGLKVLKDYWTKAVGL